MASVDEAVKAQLDAELAAHVGTRTYPGKLPQNVTYPAVRYQKIDGGRFHAMGADAAVRPLDMQVDGFAESYDTASTLMGAIADALDRWTNASSPVVQGTLIESTVGPLWRDTVGSKGGYMVSVMATIYYEG